MKQFFCLLAFSLLSTPGHAIKLSDYYPFDYQVAFTNPICRTYSYETPLAKESGTGEVYAKPKNVYCKSRDKKASAKRANSPMSLLLSWINDEETKEIFLAYLSYSSRQVSKALCTAMRERGVEVHLIYDSHNEQPKKQKKNGKVITTYPRMKFIHNLQSDQCKYISQNGRPYQKIWVYSRGGKGKGNDRAGFAHNKVIVINPQNLQDQDKEKVRIAFSSGNMSSGVTIHHENWHFITTHPQSYFAQAHLCLIKGMKNDHGGRKKYQQSIARCKRRIKAEEEEDIKTFFIPGEGKSAEKFIAKAFRKARGIDVAAHRFTYPWVELQMRQALQADKQVRLVVDDDLYWSEKFQTNMGRNTIFEARKIKRLVRHGLQVAYMETNGGIADPKKQDQARPYLHHNKFFIFHFPKNSGAVFTGAGNLTKSAFTKNFENFYYIEIQNDQVDVYQDFKDQYHHMWENLATTSGDMPVELQMP